MKPYIEYNKSLKQNARSLRNSSTLSEVLLWQELRAGKMMGYKFNRQKPLGNYIVDFYCKPLNLVIEVDGRSHDNKHEYDKKRDSELEQMGLSVLHFADLQVKKDMNNVIRALQIWIEEKTNPPNPL